MNDQLTKEDIRMLQQELDYRRKVLAPKIAEDIRTAREFGDLSENFEYKAAKYERSRNNKRMHYLQKMIETAQIVASGTKGEGIGLNDTVEYYVPEDDETETIKIVTTVRCDPLQGLVSMESPVGLALMGKKAGDRVHISVKGGDSYDIEIRKVTKAN